MVVARGSQAAAWLQKTQITEQEATNFALNKDLEP
jgi:hypothetical protein